MQTGILGVLNHENVVPSLIQGLQNLESEDTDGELVSIATVMTGRIRHLQFINPLKKSSQALYGRFALAYTRQTVPTELKMPHAYLCHTEQVALAHYGVINNIQSIREELLERGGYFKGSTDCEVLLQLLHRYLELGLSPTEANAAILERLEGFFAQISLFAEPHDLLISIRRGCPLTMGVDDNKLYVGSDSKLIKKLSQQVIELEQGSPTVLHSIDVARQQFLS
jgi:glutamine---fructose-6-phosphate transaminase (isomerizing)